MFQREVFEQQSFATALLLGRATPTSALHSLREIQLLFTWFVLKTSSQLQLSAIAALLNMKLLF